MSELSIATRQTIGGGMTAAFEAAECGKQVNAVACGSSLKAANLDGHVIQPKKTAGHRG